jgi:hypothetical protein
VPAIAATQQAISTQRSNKETDINSQYTNAMNPSDAQLFFYLALSSDNPKNKKRSIIAKRLKSLAKIQSETLLAAQSLPTREIQ